MRNRCEELAAEAIAAGLDSKEANAWRIHCRSCSKCRTEFFILENLERQAQQERRHLPRDEVAFLLQTAQRYQEKRHFAATAWSGALKVACLFALLLLAFGLQYRTHGPASNPVDGAGHDAGGSASAQPRKGRATVASPASGETAVAAEMPASPSAAEQRPRRFPETPLDQRLDNLRDDIDSHRRELLEMLEEDLDEMELEDIPDGTRSANHTIH